MAEVENQGMNQSSTFHILAHAHQFFDVGPVAHLYHFLGDDGALLVDGNSGFSPARAIEVGRMLEANGYEHFEEPCPYWELEQTAEVFDELYALLDAKRDELDISDIAYSYDRSGGRSRGKVLKSSIRRRTRFSRRIMVLLLNSIRRSVHGGGFITNCCRKLDLKPRFSALRENLVRPSSSTPTNARTCW